MRRLSWRGLERARAGPDRRKGWSIPHICGAYHTTQWIMSLFLGRVHRSTPGLGRGRGVEGSFRHTWTLYQKSILRFYSCSWPEANLYVPSQSHPSIERQTRLRRAWTVAPALHAPRPPVPVAPAQATHPSNDTQGQMSHRQPSDHAPHLFHSVGSVTPDPLSPGTQRGPLSGATAAHWPRDTPLREVPLTPGTYDVLYRVVSEVLRQFGVA